MPCALHGAHTLFERYRPRLVQLEGKRKRILVCARAMATKFDYVMGTRHGFDGNFVLYDARVVAHHVVHRSVPAPRVQVG